jgi:hypothetical protein
MSCGGASLRSVLAFSFSNACRVRPFWFSRAELPSDDCFAGGADPLGELFLSQLERLFELSDLGWRYGIAL